MYAGILSIASIAPQEYAISAIAIALLMILSYKIVTNQKIISIVDKILNKSLEKTHLYKILKILIISVLFFSCLVVLLAFGSIYLSQRNANESQQNSNAALSLVLQAQKEFSEGHYENARKIYFKQLEESPDAPTSDQTKGMITATFYGQQLHRQGLDFLCNEYKHKARDFHGYMFAVHAHLRAIAVLEGPLFFYSSVERSHIQLRMFSRS